MPDPRPTGTVPIVSGLWPLTEGPDLAEPPRLTGTVTIVNLRTLAAMVPVVTGLDG